MYLIDRLNQTSHNKILIDKSVLSYNLIILWNIRISNKFYRKQKTLIVKQRTSITDPTEKNRIYMYKWMKEKRRWANVKTHNKKD